MPTRGNVHEIALDTTNGAITLFFDGEQIGPTLQFVGADAPVLPTLYVRAPGVIVSVTGWNVTLR